MPDGEMPGQEPGAGGKPPSLQQQTIALGRTLKAISEQDPSGTPSETASAVFAGWLAAAGPTSREPAYLADVAVNFDTQANTNKDLWELFDILDNYIEVEEEDWEDEPPAARRRFIGLPLASG